MYFLAHQRADSAFGLIFSFVKEDQELSTETSFEQLIRELFNGLCPSPAVVARLKSIYLNVLSTKTDYHALSEIFVRDFNSQPEVLVSVFQLLLRYCTDDGMISRHDSVRLRELYLAFKLREEDILVLELEEREIIERLVFGAADSPMPRQTSLSLHQSYQILECTPQDSDSALRKSYRRLAKSLHPDRNQSEENSFSSKSGFIEVQHAYEAIMKSRR